MRGMAESRTRRILTAPFRGLKAAGTAIIHPRAALSLFLPSTRFDYARAVGDGTGSSVVMAPIRWLQRNSPQAILRVSTRAADGRTWTPIEPGASGAGRMLTLVDQPNPYYDGTVLEEATTLSEELDGNAYWMIVRNGLGAPIELWWTPHTLMEPKRDEGAREFITHYEYTPEGVPIRIRPEDVIHFRVGIDPENPMKGMSGFKSLLREIFTDDEAANYAATLLKNTGVPGLVVSPEADSSGVLPPQGDDLKQVKREFEQATTGDNRGRPLIMRGPTRVTTIGFSPSDMNVRELRRLPEERVSAVLGVPAIVAGLGAGLERSTFANFSEAREAAAEEALIPRWKRRARVLKHRLLPEFVDAALAMAMRVDHDLADVRVLSEDQDKIAERMVRLVNGGLATVGEGREPLGLPVDASHDVFLRAVQYMEVPSGASQSDVLALEAARNPATPADTTNDGVAQPKALTGAVKGLNQQQRAALELGMQRVRDSHVPQFSALLEKAFHDLGDHVAAAYSASAYAESHAGKALDNGDLVVVDATMARAAVKAWQKQHLQPIYTQHYSAVLHSTGKTITSTIGLSIEKEAPAVELQVLREGGTQLGLVDLDGQTRTAIFRALEDGRKDGLNPVQLERQVREYVTNGGPTASVSSRAMVIARTETRHAQNYAAVELYKATGAYDAIQVLDNRTGHDDADCMQRDGEVVGFDQAQAFESDEHPNGTLDTTTPASVRD